jgi:hypothetical protein
MTYYPQCLMEFLTDAIRDGYQVIVYDEDHVAERDGLDVIDNLIIRLTNIHQWVDIWLRDLDAGTVAGY